MANRCSRFTLVLVLSASGSWAGQTAATQSPTANEPAPQGAERANGAKTPTRAASPRLKIDIERHISEAIASDPTLALPHFKEQIEVRDAYQEALEALLLGVDMECGASQSGPPTRLEMNPYRGATVPVHADFIAPAKLIAKGLNRLFGSKEPRYFLYAVHRPTVPTGSPADAPSIARLPPPASTQGASTPGTADYVLREGSISENARSSVPGTSWELVATFHDRESGLAAVDRLRRGFVRMQRAHDDGQLPPWVSTTCRPPRLR